MKPAYKHMTSDAGRKLEIGHGHIRDLCLKVSATGGRDYTGHRTHEPENDREVVRRKAPEDVLLAPHLAEVQTIGIDVTKLSKLAVGDQLSQPQNGGVIFEQM